MDITEHRKRLSALENSRSEWEEHWKEITDYVLPYCGRYKDRDADGRHKRRRNLIIDGTASRALRVLAAGMQGGLTSPARPWFRLKYEDDGLMEWGPARDWLASVEKIMYAALAGSNFYHTIHTVYLELAGFGTTCVITTEKDVGELLFRAATAGRYSLSINAQSEVDLLYRSAFKPGRALLAEFKDKISPQLKEQVKRNPFSLFEVIHTVGPREDRDPEKKDSQNLPWESVWFTRTGNEDRPLKISGFEEKPFFAPRWHVVADDAYGESPTMDVLPDVKMLQEMQKDSIKALQLEIQPPLQAPSSFKHKVNMTPGYVNFFDTATQEKIGRLYDIRFDQNAVQVKIQDTRAGIREGLYNDMFLMILERPRMTATEVAERHEEKLLMLGPVIERQMNELLDPCIERVFGILSRAGKFPPPPVEAQGLEMKVEYVSLLAQAQKLVSTTSMQSVLSFAGMLAQLDQSCIDKIDCDQAIDEYAEATGAPPRIIRSDDTVEKIRHARQEQAAREAEAQQAMAGIQAAEGLSNIDTEPGNALGDLKREMELF